jgi:two-component system phosphate regulon sensor histidine kinase PhoR
MRLFSSIRKSLLTIVVLLVLFNALLYILYILLAIEPGAFTGTVFLHLSLIAVGSLAVSSLSIVFFTRSMTTSLKSIAGFIQDLVPGQPFNKLVSTREDEIGELAHETNQLAERTNEKFHQLSSERNRLDLVLSRIEDGIFLLDGEGIIRNINPSAETIFGINKTTSVGMSFIEAVRDYELDKPVRKCLRTKKPQQEYLDLRHRGLYLGMIATPLATEPGCLVLIQDLSRLNKLEMIRKDFIANVSHELRTPVSSIKLLSETLEEGALEDPGVSKKFLGQMIQEVDKLEGIVEGMTTLAKIESGEVRLKKKPVDIVRLVEQVTKRLQGMAAEKEQALTVVIPAEEVLVMADALQLEQVIFNITHNAIKFTPPGGTVTIRVTFDEQQVVVSTSDTGFGIDPADLARIFERFFKSDKSHSSQGSGLGLAISRHIIEAHSGRIWAEPAPGGKGSRISFSLPV